MATIFCSLSRSRLFLRPGGGVGRDTPEGVREYPTQRGGVPGDPKIGVKKSPKKGGQKIIFCLRQDPKVPGRTPPQGVSGRAHPPTHPPPGVERGGGLPTLKISLVSIERWHAYGSKIQGLRCKDGMRDWPPPVFELPHRTSESHTTEPLQTENEAWDGATETG